MRSQNSFNNLAVIDASVQDKDLSEVVMHTLIGLTI